jgi:hypothetical protein
VRPTDGGNLRATSGDSDLLLDRIFFAFQHIFRKIFTFTSLNDLIVDLEPKLGATGLGAELVDTEFGRSRLHDFQYRQLKQEV